MAEQITQDVVKEAQSTGDVSPVDVNATSTNTTAGNGTAPSGPINLDSKSSEAASAPAASSNSQNQPNAGLADTKEQLVNGDAGETFALELQQAVADASGGSDTDISRPGSVDQAQRPGGHLRTNSIKKPTSFKSVSVTKNFLAKSAVSTPVARPGEKPAVSGPAAASTLLIAKPRLVAKSGGGNVLHTLGKKNGPGTGPDASKVWNKNQPVPPPPPKQFTDEELKQQYGIHLATRLQADDGGKEAKWADIDDEDDWTPDTVQWMDGTKSTVAAVQDEPPPPEEPKTILKPAAVAKPTPPPTASSQKTTLNTSTKAILKPGASLASVSKPKGQPDKATLVAKPSASAPVKSPWAPLPPVEKASPVLINPPVQPPPSRYRRDSQGYDAMQPIPAKEIAPDDFNRSWRDERGPRELFNSHSGRYEPVRETRRGSIRENNFRQQPSVLQRPSNEGPAEPSAAFQTSRTSADGPAWGRRRNSSNVSGESGRHMFLENRGSELPPIPMNISRRDSQSINGADAEIPAPGMSQIALPARPLPTDQQPIAQLTKPSPSMLQAQPASPFGSITSQDAAAPVAPPIQNLVEVQQRVMHGNIDTIKQRKQEEREREAKEEADRKERLRLKMEALGLNAESKKAEEAPLSRPPQRSPLKEKAVPAAVQSPPKPPVPTAQGEVAQYGMMKVHQPQPVKKPSPEVIASRPALVKVQSDAESKPASSNSQDSLPTRPARDTSVKLPLVQSQQSTPGSGPQGSKPGQATQAPGSWSNSLSQQPRPWTSSVWGPPQAKDRALGNGTFVQQVGAQSQPSQAPIGVNPALRPTSSHQQPTPNQPFTQQAMYPKAGAAPGQSGPAPKPGPIAPPLAKGWGNFQEQIRRDDREMVLKVQQNLERLGGEIFRPEIREKYTDQQGKSQTILHGKVGGIDARAAPSNTVTDSKPKEEVARAALDTPSPSHGLGSHPPAQGARSSRFFPKPSETAPQASLASTGESPPPPETQSHPVFGGESEHPIVKMPKPSPRVKLPPTAVDPLQQPEAPVSMPAGPRTRVGPGMGSRPLALTAEWQARFNNLLHVGAPGAANAPVPKPNASALATVQTPSALAVAVSSKAPLEVREGSSSATVSLPTNKKTFINDGSSEVTTRISSDLLLEDREFGSLPTIKLTKVPHLAANEPAVGFPPATRQNSRYTRWPESEMFTKPSYNGELDRNSETIDFRIKMGKMEEAVVRSVPRKRRNGKGPGQPKPRRNNFQNGSNGGSPTNAQPRGPRKPSNISSQDVRSNSSPRSSTGSPWTNNNRSTSAHTNQPWNRRAVPTAPVH